MKCDILIIDSNCLCHIAKNSTKDLSFSGIKTGVIFGFFNILVSVVEAFEYKTIAFVWDSPYSLRKELYPEYKASRKKRSEEEIEFLNNDIYPQFNFLRDIILPKLGFKNNFIQNGYEADDLIASIIRENIGTTAIVTRDHDLFQCVSNKTFIFDPISKIVIDEKYVERVSGIESVNYPILLSIIGCKSDEIKGVKGIGPVKALNFIKGKMLVTNKHYINISNSNEIIKRNFELVKLPYLGVQKCEIKQDDKISKLNFIDICNELGFSSFLKKLNRFVKVFKMG